MTAPQRTGGKTFESRLQGALAPVDSPETRSSIERVMQAGGTSWHGLVEILQDSRQSRELRDTVAWLLPRLGDWRAAPPLLSVATNTNEDSELRQECVRQCRFLNHKRVVAEAMYRRVLADDLEEVPVLQFDALDDLANLLRNQPGREAEARELHRQAMELASRRGFQLAGYLHDDWESAP